MLKFDPQLIEKFLYWIKERHAIYIKKEAGKPSPWTTDPILDKYKFTNPFRQNDRVTKELAIRLKGIKTVEDIFKNIIIFRMFNWPPTYDVLKANGLVDKWSTAKAKKVLDRYSKDGNKVFTGAYIITNSGSSKSKIHLMCESIHYILKDTDSIISAMKTHNTLEAAVDILMLYDMIGRFIAYELVTDLRHTKILNKASDIYTWANPGPGAKRGMHRLLFGTTRGDKPRGLTINNTLVKSVDYQDTMQRLLFMTDVKLGKLKLFKDVKFEMRDIEHSLCEFDKYMRVQNGEGKPRSIYHHTGRQ